MCNALMFKRSTFYSKGLFRDLFLHSFLFQVLFFKNDMSDTATKADRTIPQAIMLFICVTAFVTQIKSIVAWGNGLV